MEWAERSRRRGPAHRALVVGCGPGADAAYLSGLGWGVTAFDVSPSAIAAARRRFPTVPADFRVADVLDPPAGVDGPYDLVLESYTTQSLPVRLRPTVIRHVRRFVAVGGTLLVLAAAEDEHSAAGPPWPLTREEVDAFAGEGLRASGRRGSAHATGRPSVACAVPPNRAWPRRRPGTSSQASLASPIACSTLPSAWSPDALGLQVGLSVASPTLLLDLAAQLVGLAFDLVSEATHSSRPSLDGARRFRAPVNYDLGEKHAPVCAAYPM